MSKKQRGDQGREFWRAMVFALGIAFVCSGGAFLASTVKSEAPVESRTPKLAEAAGMVLPTH